MPDTQAFVVKPRDLSRDDIAQWRLLQESSPGLASPFLSHSYAAMAQLVFADVRVAKFVRDGKAVGFFPFQFRSGLHRLFGIGERISGELADYFGLIAARDFQMPANDLLGRAGLRTLYFTHLDESQTAFGLTGEQPEPGLRIEFAEGGQAFWEERRKQDKKFTSDTERRERKLVETHGPLRFVFRHEHPATELRQLIEAKRKQYGRTGVKDCFEPAVARSFLEKLSSSEEPDCRAVLSTLHAGDQWVGSHFGLMHGSCLHYWFPVYNPDMRAFAPGRLLLKSIIQMSDETGVRSIDRGSGDTQAKRDFANARHNYSRGVWARPGPVALAYRAGLSAQWRLKGFFEGARGEKE